MSELAIPPINVSVLDAQGYMRPEWYRALGGSITLAQEAAVEAAASAAAADAAAATAQGTADQGATDAAAAQSTADSAQADVNALEPIEYVVAILDPATPDARVLTGSAGLTVDFTTPGVALLALDVPAPLPATQASVLVSALGTATAGARKFVSDALAPVALAVVVGGGAVKVPVYGDGAAWRVG